MAKKEYSFKLKSNLSELDNLCQNLEDFGKKIGLSKKLIFEINLALDELFTNIISYGFKDENEDEEYEEESQEDIDQNEIDELLAEADEDITSPTEQQETQEENEQQVQDQEDQQEEEEYKEDPEDPQDATVQPRRSTRE